MEGRIVSHEIGYLAETMAMQSVEGTACLLLNAYHKIQEEGNDLETEWLIKKETTQIFGKFSVYPY